MSTLPTVKEPVSSGGKTQIQGSDPIAFFVELNNLRYAFW